MKVENKRKTGEGLRRMMWPVLKAEVGYYKLGLIVNLIVVTSLFVLCMTRRIEFEFYGAFTMMAYWITVALVGVADDKEKHDRLHAGLPVKTQSLAAVRVGFLLSYFCATLVLWLVLWAVTGFEDRGAVFREMISMMSLVFIVVNLIIIFTDLGFFSNRLYRIVYLSVVMALFGLLIVLAVLNIMAYPLNFGPGSPKSWIDMTAFAAVCIGLFVWDYRLFIRRHSYLR